MKPAPAAGQDLYQMNSLSPLGSQRLGEMWKTQKHEMWNNFKVLKR